jgi:hypothetical protein
MPPSTLAVGERTMVAASHRGGTLWAELGVTTAAPFAEHGVQLTFGVAEPHLTSMYADLGQRPYAQRNFFSEESGYVIPNVSLLAELADHGVRREWRTGAAYQALPPGVQAILAGTGAVHNASLTSESEYWAELNAALSCLPNGTAALFGGLGEDEIRRCTARSTMIDCAVGDQIIKRDGTARNMYLVLTGELEVRHTETRIRSLRAGDLFGESGFLLDRSRTADVFVTADDTRVLALGDRGLRSFITEQPEGGTKLLTNLTRILASRLDERGDLTG